ncbi:MAG: hypothetical protein KA178_12910 [Alphaproteobacteria bacterium]|nr:hypothetical protein [Alphaproteobacteria bacterium]MBP7760145.1 hypothetical protein [Alphaproteobacteria bacterium]MBP7763514.1 hypothetical protein [Alphaproteobacteria bacterium]
MAKRLEKKYKAALNPAPWVAPEEGNKAKRYYKDYLQNIRNPPNYTSSLTDFVP